MEQWQKSYLQKHLDTLLESMIVNTMLIAKLISSGVIGIADVEEIDSICENRRKSLKFVTILMTRNTAYRYLTKALFECKQSAAAKTLMQGYAENGIKNILTECGIEIDWEEFLSSDVNVQGRIVTFRQIFPNLCANDLLEIFQNSPMSSDFIDVLLFGRNEQLKLIKNTLPTAPHFYIDRFISNRLPLDPDIFEQNCSDIFVMKEIERHELSKIAVSNCTSRASDQIYQLSSRFILLDDDEYWTELKNLNRSTTNHPMHLIRVEKVFAKHTLKQYLYILEDTNGKSKILFKFIKQTSKQNKIYISEDEFVEKLESEEPRSGICICDTPGMGKTYLLESIARKYLKRYPTKIIAYFSLPEFISTFSITECASTLSHCMALEAAIGSVCTCTMSKAFFKKALEKKGIQLQIFFDGLDEVPAHQLDFTKTFLKALVSEEGCVRILVTSRPHLREELENILGVISYDILPLTEDNQIAFLVQTWKQKFPCSEESKLRDIGTQVLENFRMTINRESRDMFGIPLLCFLLAEVYAKEARINASPTRKTDEFLIKETSIYELFKQFIDLRFNDSTDKAPKKRKSDQSDDSITTIKKYHLWFALRHIFPEIADEYTKIVGVTKPTGCIFSHGILERIQQESRPMTRFVHKTIAEFMVAECFARTLAGNGESCIKSDAFIEFTLRKVLATFEAGRRKDSLKLNWYKDMKSKHKSANISFPKIEFQHSVIVSFLNMHLKFNENQEQQVSSALKNCFQHNIHYSKIFEMLSASVRANHVHLLRVLKNTLMSLPKEHLQKLKPHVLYDESRLKLKLVQPSSQLLYLSASHPVHLMTELFQMFRDCFQYKEEVTMALDNPPNFHIPFHRAVEEGNYEVVEYLMNTEHIFVHNRQLLFYCVVNTYEQPEAMIQRKIQLLKLLLAESKSLLYEDAFTFLGICEMLEYYQCKSCLFAESVHLKILKYLISEGANFRAVPFDLLDSQNCSFFQQTFHYMSPNDFDDFIKFLLTNCNATDLFTKHKTLNFILRDHQNLQLQTVQDILKIPGIKVNKRDQWGFNTFMLAVQGEQSLEILQELVAVGAKYHYKTTDGESALHLAAEKENKEVIEYLLSLGLCIEERDNKGNTPILFTSFKLEIIKFLAENGADTLATNNDGETIAHKAADQMYSADDFHQLVFLLLEKWNARSIFTKSSTGESSGTPLHIRLALAPINIETLRLLLSVFPSENMQEVDTSGNSYLHVAVQSLKPVPILVELVKRGVNYNLKNKEGKTALDLAISRNNYKAVEYFQSLDI